MIQPWKTIGSKPLGNFRIFTIRSDRKISPRTQKEHDFYVIDSVNWVNVVAVTPDQKGWSRIDQVPEPTQMGGVASAKPVGATTQASAAASSKPSQAIARPNWAKKE